MSKIVMVAIFSNIAPLTILLGFAVFPISLAAGQAPDPTFFEEIQEMLRRKDSPKVPDAEPLPQTTRPVRNARDEASLTARRQLLLGAARNASAQGNVDLAHRRYEAVLREFPNDEETQFELVGLLMRWGKWRQAETGIRKLAAAAPENDTYQEILADVLIQRQQLAEATDVLMALSQQKELSPSVAIRLGRILAWQKKYERAEQVIARVVHRKRSLPADLRLGLAQYYNESHQPQKALDLAIKLDQQGVDSIDLEVVLARAHSELGDLDEAYQHVLAMGLHPSRDVRPRLDLADDFYRSAHYKLALAVYQQVVELGHADAVVTAKIITAQVRLLDLPTAEKTFENALAQNSSLAEDPEMLAARANYLVVAGRHAEAERLYRQLIQADPSNVDVQNGYGHLWFSVGDYLRAESEYRVALAKGRGSRKTINFLARALVNSRQYDRAIQLLAEATDREERSQNLIPMVESMSAARMHSDLLALCQDAVPETDGHRDRMRLLVEMGFAKMHLGDLGGATQLFETVLRDYDPLSPQATYGLIRVRQRSADPWGAEIIIAEFDRSVGNNLLRRMQMADLATADCDGRLAERILLPALASSPENVFVLIRLGEAVSLVDRTCGTCRDRHYFQQALALQPDNTRARLGMARSYARSRHVSESRSEYQTLLADFPAHRLANEELSRVTYRACGDDWGMAEYSRARGRLTQARRETFAEVPPEHIGDAPIAQDEMLIAEPPEEELPALESADLEQWLLETEASGKYFKRWRPRRALCFYRPLVRVNRMNEEGYFDLGQVFGAMDYTAAAAGRFCELLNVNPCHTEAQIALRRTFLERSPQWWSDVDVMDEEGRDGLTEMTRVRLSTLGRYPLGDENEYLYAGYAHEWLNGAYDSDFQADIALLGGRRRIWDYTTVFIDAEIAGYTSGFSTRPELQTGVQWRNCRDVVWTLAGFIDNVDSNSESISQDIYRRGVKLSVYVPCNWRWSIDGSYRWGNYSDDNNSHEVLLVSKYLLRHGCGRREWRSIVEGYFYNFDEQTIRGPNPLTLSGTIHPYWAPEGFVHVTAGLEFKRWLSRYTFKYANQWWWSAFAGARVDSEGEGYGIGALRCRRDICNWLTTGVDASLIQSRVYDSAGIRGYGIVRFH